MYNWFRLVQNTTAKYGIHSDDIYNFDETGFLIVERYDQSGSNGYYLTDYNLYLRTFLIERSY